MPNQKILVPNHGIFSCISVLLWVPWVLLWAFAPRRRITFFLSAQESVASSTACHKILGRRPATTSKGPCALDYCARALFAARARLTASGVEFEAVRCGLRDRLWRNDLLRALFHTNAQTVITSNSVRVHSHVKYKARAKNSLQIYIVSFKWMFIDKKWVNMQAINKEQRFFFFSKEV